MQAVYLLLRDNQETGPYTIDELLQQHLRPTDLIWVEGASCAWAYSYEIAELKKIMDSRGEKEKEEKRKERRKDEIEQKAEELRQQILSYRPTYINWSRPAPVHKPQDILRAMEEEQVEFIDHSRRGFTAYEWLAGLILVVLVGASIYGGHALYRNNQVLSMQTSQAIETKRESISVAQPPRQAAAPTVLRDTTQSADSIVADSVAMLAVISRNAATRKEVAAASMPESTAVATTPIPKDTVTEAIVLKEEPKNEEPKKEDLAAVKDSAANTPATVEKKSFGQVLKGLFKKKKKKESPDTSQTDPAS